jgi:hypothetical protein
LDVYLETLVNTTKVLQSIATTAAIVIGGAWALYTFRALKTRTKAEAEIAALEHSVAEQPVLQIELHVKPAPSISQATDSWAAVSVTLRNDGTRTTCVAALAWQVVRLGPDKEAAPSSASKRGKVLTFEPDGSLSDDLSRFLRARQERRVAFFVDGLPSGYYLLQFDCEYRGVVIENGEFVESPDPPIRAWEQAVFTIR